MASDLVEHLRRLPDDWDSWLVYADELTERGDVRGELLVLEHRGADPCEPVSRATRARARELADDWITAWGQHLGPDDVDTYLWIRGLAPLADPPTPLELLSVFGRPISQLISLLDPEQPTPPPVSPIFELHRAHVIEATLAWIDRAFDGVPVPDADHSTIHQAEAADNRAGCDRSRDHLGRWQELPDAHLLANQWGLPHLDEQGIHYYVPAIMSFALRHPSSGDWIVESLGYTLQSKGNTDGLRTYQRERFALLDREQRAAIYGYALVVGDEAAPAWARVFEAERTGERADWFEVYSPA